MQQGLRLRETEHGMDKPIKVFANSSKSRPLHHQSTKKNFLYIALVSVVASRVFIYQARGTYFPN